MRKTTPVGTIVSSLMDYRQFAFAVSKMGNPTAPVPSPIPQPAPINPTTTEWVPADGRAVQGSLYHKITGRTNVPDLRGLFLRGVNNFDPQWTPSPQNPGQLDPDGMRVFGSYQADELKSHTHSFTYREPGGSGSSGEPGHQGLQNANGTTAGSGGNETRSKNAAVGYYICIN